jgi:hypothetical protein
LGAYLIEQGLLTEARLQAALAEQRARHAAGTQARLGDLLIQRGWLTPRALANSVALQDDTQQAAEGAEPERLGTYQLRHGFITPDQLEATLWLQLELRHKGQPILLGELLIRLGYVTPAAVAAALERQRQAFVNHFGE